MPRVQVAVIARPGAPLDACLGALARAGCPDPLVERATFAGGLAAARNAALARCRAEVLAYLEDDVAVAPGWLATLEAAWAGADAGPAGCIGGPLRAERRGDRPAWLTEPLLGAFAVGPELGDAPGPVDPRRATFHAGNVSFRAAALRGAGGFWPARGHLWHGRDWFADEHETQRALGRAGWELRHAPAAEAVRVLPAPVRRTDVLRRRWRYGARLALVGGGRPVAVAARAAATGAAGALVAAVRGEPAAMERAARAAENLGVLAAPFAAHADLQPTAARTPFRHTVARPAPDPLRAAAGRARRGARDRLRGPRTGVRTAAVLLYHRIERVERDPLGLAVAPAHFAEHLGVLAGRTVPLAELAAGDAPAGSVALTFDDGYADNLREALPALAAAGVPATLFVATGAVEAGAGFWWDTVDRLLLAAARGSGPLTVTLGGDTRAWPARSAAERDQARGHLHAWLQARPPEQIGDVLAQLGAWAGADPTATPDRDRPLTVAELRQLAAAGPFAVGAHTRSHRSLAPSPRAVQREELAGSGDDLARWLGAVPEAVSYPFGVPGVDVDATTVAVARELGYRVGVVNAPGRIGPATPRLALPRLTAPDVPGGAFAAWLDEQLRA